MTPHRTTYARVIGTTDDESPSGRADANWTVWAAAVWCEAFHNGSYKHIMALKFLRAPHKVAAMRGACEMLRAEYPNGEDFEAIAAEVPAGDAPDA